MFTEAVSLGRVVANSEKCRARFCVLIHMTLTGHYIHRESSVSSPMASTIFRPAMRPAWRNACLDESTS